MIGFQQISTQSTMNDYNHTTNKINIDEEKDVGEIPEWSNLYQCLWS